MQQIAHEKSGSGGLGSPSQLRVSVGQYSDKGRKPANQDFHGAYLPREPQLTAKGVAVALADGISSSDVSHIASQAAVTGFLEDYFCTSETWSVKKSAQRVLVAINSWLYAQTRQSQYRYERDKGYVCTFSAVVIKSTTAHLFHIGDARIYRLRDARLEQMTNDHRFWVSREKSYLARALGINPHLEIDYHSVPVEPGDLFLLATDGVYEWLPEDFITTTLGSASSELDQAMRQLVSRAIERGSDDNLTAQVVRIDSLATGNAEEIRQLSDLPLPPVLEPRAILDGYRIVRTLHASSRSHVYLAVDPEHGGHVVLKAPSVDLQHDAAHLERFLTEEWIARRINALHVLKSIAPSRRRNHLYTVNEYVEGQTLAQWMLDHPQPSLEAVRGIVEQIARGLRAFHRLEMLHQDLRPANVMIDHSGTVKIIDFGAARVAGIAEMNPAAQELRLGTAQYAAPEYFLGEVGTPRSDLYSLGVITYQMLCGKLPYGAHAARAHNRAAQNRLVYRSVLSDTRDIPAWVDEVLRRAVHPNPAKRYAELSEFLYDLRQPNPAFVNRSRPPLLQRNPVAVWQGVSAVLAAALAYVLLR
ncbi:bifunctional protein-serine/threonine kinase/phosphatase [Halopseudomonas nanhaiensis]|uniref:bifunctional protein-serine/threonine kinase/phosphatase n=1 Tax=Halopseudomonas nanhaiensis TaxID=2830842 RepID=UPI001CBF2871|nr:bifunctional protein-serine/threonine kinase/phosphatase [Halopseudomonas nanhaiensis]UAW97547.1 bifunctional protein-serine/threonine kinase/phosphatase [Halopseudomonas nanhaiensis]